MITKRFLASYVLLFLFASAASATTRTAATCNAADVQNAINASSNGDTVQIPAGTCTWTSGVSVSGKGIAIQGAGGGRIIAYDNGTEVLSIATGSLTVNLAGFSPGFSASSITVGQTLRVFQNNSQNNWMQGTVTSISGNVLKMNITNTGGSGSTHRWLVSTLPSTVLIDNASTAMFALTESSSSNVSLSGLQIIAGTNTKGVIALSYNASGGLPILIHDNWMQLTSGSEMIDSTTNRGVIWHNSFSGSTGNPGQMTTTAALRIKGAPVSSWNTPSTWGAADATGTGAMYFETNDVHALQSASDNDDNGRLVWRYNLMDHSTFGTHGADTSTYGQRYFEFYNNVGVFYGFSDGSTLNMANGWVGLVRGGTFVMHHNTLPAIQSTDYGTKTDVLMLVMNLRRNGGPNPCWGAGTTGGQNYQAPRQVGMGYVTGLGKNVFGSKTDSATYVGDSEPAYIWGNSRQPLSNIGVEDYALGQSDSCSGTLDTSANYIVANRDYFNGSTAKPGYTPYTYPHPLAGGTAPPPPPAVPAPSGLLTQIQ
jgi:hypothetical protein